MLRTLGAAGSLGGLLYYKSSVLLPRRMTLMAEEAASVPNFMATPMTDLSNVTYNSDMRLRMESFIMGLQYDLCKALEAEEVGGQTFRVDRWKKIKKATVQHLQKLLNKEAKFENKFYSWFMVTGGAERRAGEA